MTQNLPKEYELHVSTNDVRAAIADSASRLYDWLDVVLTEADDSDDDESDLIQFARDVFSAIGRHPAELSYGDESSQSDDDVSALEFE